MESLIMLGIVVFLIIRSQVLLYRERQRDELRQKQHQQKVVRSEAVNKSIGIERKEQFEKDRVERKERIKKDWEELGKHVGTNSFWTDSELEDNKKKSQKRWDIINSNETSSLLRPNQQPKSSVDRSQKKKYLYTHSERRIRYCSSCYKEICPHTTYVTEKYESEKWEEIIFPEEERVYCSWSCAQDSLGGDDYYNTPFGNYK